LFFNDNQKNKKPPHKKREFHPPIIKKLLNSKFRVSSFGDYDLNIVGVRTLSNQPNKFNDYLYCIYKIDGRWKQHRWDITTDPGIYWLRHPTNKLGTACVVANRQYDHVWKLGKHQGKYKALVQTGNKIAVYRDDDRNPVYDFDKNTIEEGYFGINCHRSTTATGGAVSVNRWSAGCQVFQDPDDFKEFINLCEKQVEVRGWDSFTYTLFDEWCLIENLSWDNESS
jgi:hypothetical protein